MDKYDRAIEYLTGSLLKYPRCIQHAWGVPNVTGAGALFQFATKSGGHEGSMNSGCGCLTMIRSDSRYVVHGFPEITAAIMADERIPKRADDITLETLPVFAEWQRRLDKELGREV